MKITAQEEYGLRCALQLAQSGEGGSLTLPEIAEREGLSIAYVGKLLNLLRQAGIVRSVRGRSGGYGLARSLDRISLAEVLGALGTQPWELAGCTRFPGGMEECVHTSGCSIRSLWGTLDRLVGQLLRNLTLADLLGGEKQTAARVRLLKDQVVQSAILAAGRDEE